MPAEGPAQLRSEMNMSRDPEDGGGKSDDQHDEEQAAFAALLAERARPALIPEIFGVAFVVERDGNIEPIAPFARALEKFFLLAARRFRGDARRLFDHPLQVLHLLAQFIFALREFLLLLVQRSVGMRASPGHVRLTTVASHPEKNQERGGAENNEGQGEGQADLQPLPEGSCRARRLEATAGFG